jgi:hypothetical protein
MELPHAIAAQLGGTTVRVDFLVKFDFADGVARLWNGFQTLTTSGGVTWRGMGQLGSISGLQQSLNGSAPALDLTLSGMEPGFMRLVTGDKAKWYNRAVTIYLQFFDAEWACLDDPVAVQLGLMQTVKISSQHTDAGRKEIVTVTAETPFATRRRPRFGTYTDRDQQGRFPGDLGCERVQGMAQKVIIFPDN